MAENQKQKSRHARDVSMGGTALRFSAALVLILATYNPSRISIYHWVRGSIAEGTLGPEHFLVVVLLLIGWTIYVVASYRSLGAWAWYSSPCFSPHLSGCSLTWDGLKLIHRHR